MTTKDWLITLLLLTVVPCMIMGFVWAFSSNVNVNKRNFCRAYLMFAGALMVFWTIFYVLIFGILITTIRL